jgi:hypothetical protein
MPTHKKTIKNLQNALISRVLGDDATLLRGKCAQEGQNKNLSPPPPPYIWYNPQNRPQHVVVTPKNILYIQQLGQTSRIWLLYEKKYKNVPASIRQKRRERYNPARAKSGLTFRFYLFIYLLTFKKGAVNDESKNFHAVGRRGIVRYNVVG